MKIKLLQLFMLFFVLSSFELKADDKTINQAKNFNLAQYDSVAIATDLEPDDVLALKIIFQEANDIYKTNKKYPIDLVIVGEGNTAIKKMRMEKLAQHFFEIPEGVTVKIVEGPSTSDNIFPYDGEELFDRETLKQIPYVENDGEDATQTLAELISKSNNPLIIQIKPAQELLKISSDSLLSKKTTILFYGSFNFRKTIQDQRVLKSFLFDSVRNETDVVKLQVLIDHFSAQFRQIGIVESYGLLGKESSVYSKYPWTQRIANLIENSEDPFLKTFITLTKNWNAYLVRAELQESVNLLTKIQHSVKYKPLLEELILNFNSLIDNWDDECFAEVYDTSIELITAFQKHNSNPQIADTIEMFERGLNFINQLKPSSGLQFTLSDIGVALATIDSSNYFTYRPVKILINQRGFLEPIEDPSSSTYYFDQISKETFTSLLEKVLFN